MRIRLSSPPTGGTIGAIPSKSAAHRYLICGALAKGKSLITAESTSADIDATVRCLRALGARIDRDNGRFFVEGIDMSISAPVLECGESGSTLRFLFPVAAALQGGEFKTEGRLSLRPMDDLVCAAEMHGARVERHGDRITVTGGMKGGEFLISGGLSSQFVSGLLLALPLCGGGSVCLTDKLMSAGYVDMTVEAMEKFGVTVETFENGFFVPAGSFYRPCDVPVPGDWSNAAFWLASGVRVKGLDPHSPQGDKAICGILENMGAKSDLNADGLAFEGLDALHGVEVDANDIPDAVPVISILCAAASGNSVIYGIGRLRLKESDRVRSVSDMLDSLGADFAAEDDRFVIKGRGGLLDGGEIDSANDHRIAMAAAAARYYCKGDVTVSGAEAVAKSYPDFWKDYIKLGGQADVIYSGQ